jgi:hypothetical protein
LREKVELRGVPFGERQDFEGWASRVAQKLGFGFHQGIVGHERVLAFLLSGEALGTVEHDGRRLPGFYVGGEGRAGRRGRGEELLFHFYARFWEPEAGDDCWVYSGCFADGEDEGWVHGIDPTPREGFPLCLLVFRADRVRLTGLACRTEEDLYGVYRLVEESGRDAGEKERSVL